MTMPTRTSVAIDTVIVAVEEYRELLLSMKVAPEPMHGFKLMFEAWPRLMAAHKKLEQVEEIGGPRSRTGFINPKKPKE